MNINSIPDIMANVGETFQVLIRGNETTGFVWALTNLPSCVYLLDAEYIPDHPITVGSGGTKIFTFGAVSPCSTTLEFALVRPWDLLNVEDTRQFSLLILECEPADTTTAADTE